MARKVKDGWHTICGYSVWVEDGKVRRGVAEVNGERCAVYPYRWLGKPHNCFTSDPYMSVDAFRSAVRRGTAQMF